LVGREPLPEGGCGRLAIEGGHLDLAAVSGAVSVGRRLSYCTIQVGRNEVVIGRDRGFNRIPSRAVIRTSGRAAFLVGRFPRANFMISSLGGSRLGIVKERPNISAAMAADRTYEQRFKVGKPDIVRPAVGADLYMVGAFVIAAVDQHVSQTGRAHLSEGDLLREVICAILVGCRIAP
jgi:hypothetical protein